LRVSVQPNSSDSRALVRFIHNENDLVIARSDATIPTQARSLAILEQETMILSGKNRKLKSLAELKDHKLAVIGEDERNEALVRKVLGFYGLNEKNVSLKTVVPTSNISTLLQSGSFDYVFDFLTESRVEKLKDYAFMGDSISTISVNGIKESKALVRKIPGLVNKTIEAGLLSAAHHIPDEDLDTIGTQTILLTNAKTPDWAVTALMQVLFESKGDLSVDQNFAMQIGAPSVEKDSYIPAHTVAAQYINDNVKTFFDRYDDIFYLGISFISVLSSISLAAYTRMSHVRPRHTTERVEDIIALRDKIREAKSLHELDIVETELEDILKEVLRGLKNRTLSSRGLEAFRLAYENVRDALNHQRRTVAPD